MMNARSIWNLVTFELVLFRIFLNSGYTLQMALPSNFSFGTEIHLQNIWLQLSFKVVGPRSRWWLEIAGA